MAESHISRKRYKFPPGVQGEFIRACIKKSGGGNEVIAKKLSVSVRSITDWKREKFLISMNAARALSKLSGISIPRSGKPIDEFWYVSKGAKKGGIASYKKQGGAIGDPEKRKQRWREWWEHTGKFENREIFNRTLITIPKKDARLAEFVGIMLGDGGMSKSQITITLNRESDADYVRYVSNLIGVLFGIVPSLYNKKGSLGIAVVVSSVNAIVFCQNIGLKTGNKIKQKVDMPDWVKNNRSFMKACIRGLVDTDGSVFTHKYRVDGKSYAYKKIDFSSCSRPLLNSVFVFLKDLGMRPRIEKNGKKLRIESIDTVKEYMKIIGTSNPKHLNRYLK